MDIRDKGGCFSHIITDNDSVLISQAFREFLLEDPKQLLSMELCPPYHHDFSGRAESRFAMAKPMVSKDLAQLKLVIGDDAVKYWAEAYEHAFDVINRTYFKRHGSDVYEKSPIEQRTHVAPDLQIMFPFGALCSVTDHGAKAHGLAGRQGAVLNKARRHSDGVYNVLMLDTRRVIQTMDITLTPEEGQSQLEFAEVDQPEFDFDFVSYDLDDADPSLALVEFNQSSDIDVAEDSVEPDFSLTPKFKGSADMEPPVVPIVLQLNKSKPLVKKQLFAKPTVIVKSNSKVKYSMAVLQKLPDSILKLDKSKLTKGKANYIRNRGFVVSGKSVSEALSMDVLDSQGVSEKYSYKHMVYDLNSPNNPMYLVHQDVATDKVVAHIASFKHDMYGNDNWINSLPSEDQSRPPTEQMFDHNGHMPDSFFDDRAQSYLTFMGDVAPVGVDPEHHIQIDWGNGSEEEWKFVPDLAPHGYTSTVLPDTGQCESAGAVKKRIALGFNDKPPRHLGDVHRLPREQRYSVIKSLQKEYTGLWDRGLIKLEFVRNLKPGQPVFPTTSVFSMKFNADGTFDRAKSRVCVRGDLMCEGRDYGEVQSPTVLNNSVKLIVSDCPVSGKIAVTSDIQQAFTYGKCDPKRPLYIKQFPGTDKILDSDTGQELVQKLMYRLYGDPAAPRAFHAELHDAYMCFEYKGVKWTQSKADPCVYYLHCDAAPKGKLKASVWQPAKRPVSDYISFDKSGNKVQCSSQGVEVNSDRAMNDGTCLTSAIFVDDSINTFNPGSNSHEVYLAFHAHLEKRFTMKDGCDGMDVVYSFLGMNFTWSPSLDWVRIDQPHAIDKLVSGSDVDTTKPHFTPLPPGTEVMIDECPDLDTPEGKEEARIMKEKHYRGRIGELQWIARSSRPDISAAVGKLSTVAHNPGLTHWDQTSYLVRYLHHTRNLGIIYCRGKSEYPYAYVDVAFSPHYGTSGDDYRSFMGGLFKCAGGPICWFAKYQKALALSSSESEYYGLTAAAIQAIHIQQLCTELGIYSDEPMLIYEDNKAAIKMSENSSNSKRTIHLDRRAHFIRSQVNQHNLQLEYCPTKQMVADAMTKMLPKPAFEYLRGQMGLTYEHSSALTPRVKDIVG